MAEPDFAGMTPLEAAQSIAGGDDDWDKYYNPELFQLITAACQHFSNEEIERSGHRRMGAYLERQREWSGRTFGPGKRTIGITKHIEKEIAEVRKAPDDLMEWIDIIILAGDGFWRAGGTPSQLFEMMESKQAENFSRAWPPITPDDQATEHIR